MLKFSGAVIWRLGSRATVRKYSSTGAAAFKTDKSESRSVSDKHSPGLPETSKENAGLVAAAFASLNSPEEPEKKPSLKSVKQSKLQQLDSQILKANDIDSLLLVAENAVVSRRHALKMVSVLSEWSNSNKVKIADFEKDPRFLKLCRILARTPTAQAMSSLTMAEDLGTVLGVTGDDEAARLISNLTLPQMIKVMKALQQKGRRSTPLLRALSHNITRQPGVIDLKKSADLLYSMTALNFPDPVLLDRICNDVIESLPTNKDKPSVVNSVAVSLGLLRYRHEAALTALAEWLQSNKHARPGDVASTAINDVIESLPTNKDKPSVVNSVAVSLGLLRYRHESALTALAEWLQGNKHARAGDVASAMVTFATLNFVPPQSEQLFEVAVSLKEEEMSKSSSWLDLVFALLILERAQKDQIVSVLKPEFIDKLLSSGEISIPSRRKLMMIDAYARLRFNGSIPRLAEDVSVGVPVIHTKEKAAYVNTILDTFKSLVSAETFLKRDCNSGMGFLYDAEFAVDDKCHPVPLEKALNDKSKHRIAVLGLDYHDMTRKTPQPLGAHRLAAKLLELQGFKVLQIPYTEFNPKDKLVTRVQYINQRLKQLIADKPAA